MPKCFVLLTLGNLPKFTVYNLLMDNTCIYTRSTHYNSWKQSFPHMTLFFSSSDVKKINCSLSFFTKNSQSVNSSILSVQLQLYSCYRHWRLLTENFALSIILHNDYVYLGAADSKQGRGKGDIHNRIRKLRSANLENEQEKISVFQNKCLRYILKMYLCNINQFLSRMTCWPF